MTDTGQLDQIITTGSTITTGTTTGGVSGHIRDVIVNKHGTIVVPTMSSCVLNWGGGDRIFVNRIDVRVGLPHRNDMACIRILIVIDNDPQFSVVPNLILVNNPEDIDNSSVPPDFMGSMNSFENLDYSDRFTILSDKSKILALTAGPYSFSKDCKSIEIQIDDTGVVEMNNLLLVIYSYEQSLVTVKWGLHFTVGGDDDQ